VERAAQPGRFELEHASERRRGGLRAGSLGRATDQSQHRPAPPDADSGQHHHHVRVAGDVSGFVQSGSPYQLIDYHLQNGSAAIDRATSTTLTPAIDLTATRGRGATGLVDLGAFEAPEDYTHDFVYILSPEPRRAVDRRGPGGDSLVVGY